MVASAGHDLERINAEERVAAHALTAFHALQQKAVRVQIRIAPVLRRNAEERGNRAQQVRHNSAIDRHHVAMTRELSEFGELGKGIGHKRLFQLFPSAARTTCSISARGAVSPVQISNWRAPCATSISKPEIVVSPRPRASFSRRVSWG